MLMSMGGCDGTRMEDADNDVVGEWVGDECLVWIGENGNDELSKRTWTNGSIYLVGSPCMTMPPNPNLPCDRVVCDEGKRDGSYFHQ